MLTLKLKHQDSSFEDLSSCRSFRLHKTHAHSIMEKVFKTPDLLMATLCNRKARVI